MSKEAKLPNAHDLAKLIASKLNDSDHENDYDLQEIAEKFSFKEHLSGNPFSSHFALQCIDL